MTIKIVNQSLEQRFMKLCEPREVPKRTYDPIEQMLIEDAAKDLLLLANGCIDGGMRARGFVKHIRSGTDLFRVSLQIVTASDTEAVVAAMQESDGE